MHIENVPTTVEYTFFSSTERIFTRFDNVGHKRSLNKLQVIELKSTSFSDCNAIKLEINNKVTFKNFICLVIIIEIRKYLELNYNENMYKLFL